MTFFKQLVKNEKQIWEELSNFGKSLYILNLLALIVGLIGLVVLNENGTRFWLICMGLSVLLRVGIKLTEPYR